MSCFNLRTPVKLRFYATPFFISTSLLKIKVTKTSVRNKFMIFGRNLITKLT